MRVEAQAFAVPSTALAGGGTRPKLDLIAGLLDERGAVSAAAPGVPYAVPGTPSRQVTSTSSTRQTNPRSDSSLVRPE